MILSSQIKAARALLGWQQQQLSEISGVLLPTLKRMESGTEMVKANSENVWKVQKALEDAGVIFISADEHGGPGARLKR